MSLSAAGARPALARGENLPADWGKYLDPATEFLVVRLTDPSYASYLPAPHNRAISNRSNYLIFSSDRTGSLQAVGMDLRSGQGRKLTEARELDPASLALLPKDNEFCHFDGRVLWRTKLSDLRGREVYRVTDGWDRARGFSVARDGRYAALAETRHGIYRLRLLRLPKGQDRTLVESREEIRDPMVRPRRYDVLYRSAGGSLWIVSPEARQNRQLKTAPGTPGPALWSPDGAVILYLHFPEDRTKLNTIRELNPETNEDRQVSVTSQFANFGCNRDATVFVGASRSKASPHVLLLIRMVGRELTLCEHKAADPERVAPIFSPNSQRVYYQSDKHGKPAIYSMNIERLVETTDS